MELTPDIKSGPWSVSIGAYEDGYPISIHHKTLGDMYIGEWEAAAPYMTKKAFDALWPLIDCEMSFGTKKDAKDAVRRWISMNKHDSTPIAVEREKK